MKKILVLLVMVGLLVACDRYQSVDAYIEELQTELDAVGTVDIEVVYQEDSGAIVMIINDDRYRNNYEAYLENDPEVVEAMEKSIESYRKISEDFDETLPERNGGYQLWIRDHSGEDLLKFDNGEIIYQKMKE